MNGTTATIVVMEDNPSDVQLLDMALTEAGLDYSLTVLRDGEEALAWVSSFHQHPASHRLPDVAVVDLNLPKYDGLEILSRMRRTTELAHVPALVLSSSASPREIVRVRELAATEYIRKPIDLEQYVEISNAVRRLLRAGR